MLKAYLWAAMHSPNFKHCYIKSPIVFQIRASSDYSGFCFSLRMLLRSPEIYMPFSVYGEYCKAFQLTSDYSEFDDIPF